MKLFAFLLLGSIGALAKPINDQTLAVRQTTPATATATTNLSFATANACALVSSASSAFRVARPSATTYPYINVSLALNCLNTIPINKDDARSLLQNLRVYLEFQSDKEYRKTPPTGYANPPFDLDEAINQISTRVEAGTYRSEVAFQQDVSFALRQAYDGHLYWQGDILNGVFSFSLSGFTGLASVSADGIQDPQLFFVSDLIQTGGASMVPKNGFSPSPVVRLNGMNITEAVKTLGLTTNLQDPDARYNAVLYSLGRIRDQSGSLAYTPYPPKEEYYQFDFANGSTTRLYWQAQVRQVFTNITDGSKAYRAFAPYAHLHSDEELESTWSAARTAKPTATATATTTTTATATATQRAQTTTISNIPNYPYPVIKDDANLIAGYFLNDTAYKDVAVLQITGFQPGSSYSGDYSAQFQNALAIFLSNATKAGKKKLIIDLQGNGGGLIDLGTDAYVQLFPNQNPDASANMRRSIGMDIIISSASAEVDAIFANASIANAEAYKNQPFGYQYNLDPSGKNINSTQQLLNGITYNGAKFTTFFQTNYSDPLVPSGFEITLSDPSEKPPFSPENIIVLTDGFCASTCTTFSEHMKNQAGVQFIVVGGRPQHQPVQALGGIKGSQVFTYSNILTMHNLFYNATDAELAVTKGTKWANFTMYPMARTRTSVSKSNPYAGGQDGGVNGRNSFRIGDSTHTPLQYVYEAADCRIWFTKEMLYSPVALWNRVAQVAFNQRTGTKFNSPYCVAGSTGHPTSISGGWKRGTLGPQDQGKIEAASPIFRNAPWNSVGNGSFSRASSKAVKVEATAAIFSNNCDDYAGNYWLLQLMCKASKALP